MRYRAASVDGLREALSLSLFYEQPNVPSSNALPKSRETVRQQATHIFADGTPAWSARFGA